MTKLAILADLHGNLPALEAIIQDLAHFDIDHVIVAGDVVNMGPFSEQVAQRVLDLGWPVVRGNNEYYLLDYGTDRAPETWNDPVEFSLLRWLAGQVSDATKARIALWPDALSLRFPDAPPLRVVHGVPGNAFKGIYTTTSDAEIIDMLAGTEEEYVVAGHTHLPLDRTVDRWRIFNPGSAGLPLDGNFSASYLLLDGDASGWTPTLRRVVYDRELIFNEYKRLRFVETCGAMGLFCEAAFHTARPQTGFLRWRAQECPEEPLSPALFAKYNAKYQWWEYANTAFHVNMDS